jgi:hypothetical protein
MEIDEFFAGRQESKEIFDALCKAILSLGSVKSRISKSQIAFQRRTTFAWAWTPDRYLRGKQAPLVLTIGLRHRDPSPRWKEVVKPAPGRFTHHLELYSVADIDNQIRAWLKEAWTEAA